MCVCSCVNVKLKLHFMALLSNVEEESVFLYIHMFGSRDVRREKFITFTSFIIEMLKFHTFFYLTRFFVSRKQTTFFFWNITCFTNIHLHWCVLFFETSFFVSKTESEYQISPCNVTGSDFAFPCSTVPCLGSNQFCFPPT